VKVTYWLAPRLNDSPVYSLRARTKREVLAKIASGDASDFGPVEKVVIEYRDAFDLVQQLVGSEGNFGSV